VLLMFCADEHAQTVVEAIRAAACTSNPGDGLIVVSELADVLRIRSGKRGDAAL
jgi:nitrogen regulatory protein P-II 1